jgi:hypothetical protein
MATPANYRPAWASALKVGDVLKVRDKFMTRGGQWGEVLNIDAEGVGLDFFCDIDGEPGGVPSQEFWEWSEIDPDMLPAHAQHAS